MKRATSRTANSRQTASKGLSGVELVVMWFRGFRASSAPFFITAAIELLYSIDSNPQTQPNWEVAGQAVLAGVGLRKPKDTTHASP